MLLAPTRPRLGGRTLADMSTSILSKIIPVRTKRLMFVFSVLAVIDENIRHDKVLIEKLNSLLRLPQNPELCQASFAIKSTIWKGTSGVTSYPDLTDPSMSWLDAYLQDKVAVAERFLRKCPAWLKYGEDSNDMRRDLDRLFSIMQSPETI